MYMKDSTDLIEFDRFSGFNRFSRLNGFIGSIDSVGSMDSVGLIDSWVQWIHGFVFQSILRWGISSAL